MTDDSEKTEEVAKERYIAGIRLPDYSGSVAEQRGDRRRERDKTKVLKELSIRELDHYLELRGVNDASMLFVLLNSGDQKYRDLAIQLPDSPLKFMMLSMDVHDNPKRLEWSKKLHELDPLNRVSALRYVSQLMDAGDKEMATEILATVRNCDHASNSFDRLIGEFEFARDLFGDERFGPLAVQVARTWPVRTSYYTVEHYMDSLQYPGRADKAGTDFIYGKAKDYLLDAPYAHCLRTSQDLSRS
jgi:hypothetical protein